MALCEFEANLYIESLAWPGLHSETRSQKSNQIKVYILGTLSLHNNNTLHYK